MKGGVPKARLTSTFYATFMRDDVCVPLFDEMLSQGQRFASPRQQTMLFADFCSLASWHNSLPCESILMMCMAAN